jgi:hypothetical protein
MLVSWDVGDRIIASLMLQRVGGRTNRSSIPYLVLALGDPDDQVAYGAYRMLSELVPDLGVPDDIPYWTRHRRAENERLWLWWNDELNGRHRDVPDPATQSAEIGAVRVPSHQPDQRQRARVALFSPALQVRREAVSAISQAATADDIPFLVLAMYDPDTRIAFQACTLLHRLLKLSGTTQALIHFANHRGEDSAPARSWWQAELRGDHVTDVKLREQIGLPRLSDLETRDRHIAR